MYFYNKKNQILRMNGVEGTKQFAYDYQGGIMEEKNIVIGFVSVSLQIDYELFKSILMEKGPFQ